ncbi:MAG TPA: hypothetical protein ENH10_09175 [Bacteroidetes bacterium]|nr:hypothetical protein [Bacteroidota bacterium]HEX05306.1 hypothetical protein [Bacteroidota bacterium]
MKDVSKLMIIAVIMAGFMFAATADAQPMNGGGHGNGGGFGNGPGFGMGQGIANLPDLTDSQLERILDMQKDIELKQIKMQREQNELREEFIKLAEDTDANRERLGVIQKRMDEMRLEMGRNHLSQQEQMQEILTDEQWEELGIRHAQAAKERSEGNLNRTGRGRGTGQGPGMGYGNRYQSGGFGPHGVGQGRGMNSGFCPLGR